MKLDRKKMIIIGGVLLVLFIFVGYKLLSGRKAIVNNNEQASQTDGVIPTIDSSVIVNLTPQTGNKEVILSIKNIPTNTKNLEYILSYETVEGGLQGFNSTAEIAGRNFEKKITLGTCSSGTCVYQNIKDKIKLELIFKGSGEDKYFSKEYGI